MTGALARFGHLKTFKPIHRLCVMLAAQAYASIGSVAHPLE